MILLWYFTTSLIVNLIFVMGSVISKEKSNKWNDILSSVLWPISVPLIIYLAYTNEN